MAVIQLSIRPYKWIGLSSDTKPTTVNNGNSPVPVGATFFAYDTGILYVCYDGTNWAVKDSVSGSALVGHNITGIGHGVKTVTSAGTDEALASSTVAKVVIIQAQTDNTGVIAVGAAGVDAAVATGTGVALYAGDSIALEIDNLADVYIDATVTGDGCRYTYLS